MSTVEELYEESLAAMSPQRRFERMQELFNFAREAIAHRVRRELGEIGGERLKWEVALRMYGSDPQVRPLIEQKLAEFSG